MRGGYRSALVNVLAQFSMAGFEVTLHGRFCVTAEVIRLEAFNDNFQGTFSGTPFTLASPFSTFLPAVPPPSIAIASINGVNIVQPPSGSLATPDVSIDTTSPVPLTIQATFIPPGTVITLHIFSDNDTDQTVQTTPLVGSLQSSTATANVTFPSGFSLQLVKATWTQ